MYEVKKLLNIEFDLNRLERLGKNLISESTKGEIRKSLRRLEDINARLSHVEMKEPPDVGDIYHLFMKHAPSGEKKLEQEFNSLRKIRKLAWSLSYLEKSGSGILNSEYAGIALKLIHKHFRPSMFPALLSALLKNWAISDTRQLRAVLSEQLAALRTEKSRFSKLKEKSDYYLSQDGIVSLCASLIGEQKALNEVSAYLGLPESAITYGYFSEVAETYIGILTRNKVVFEKIDEIFAFLEKHRSKDTHKKCLEKMIHQTEALESDESLKMKIIHFCFQNIGDPANESYWHPWIGANQTEQQNLKNARTILMRWLAKKFLYLFFERISVDADRKAFWNQYIDHVSNFRIYTDAYQQKHNFRDMDLEILSSKVGLLEKSRGTNAFLMEIRGYLMIEFSETGGACYIYKAGNEFRPALSKSAMPLNALRHKSNRQMAAKSAGQHVLLQDEGRIFHSGNWQTRFSAWIKEYLNIHE
ncbi:MAG: hypothetical protein B6245_03215 [Desulfobacteraceae bacterium 4572_88]|nr:MAG: hypothetical protein B6245_03215 [Desulfobacteraceae bacterium 4572_88]RLC02380.1 MAG: hypothetical protein DRI57_30115 [Deltaproteobacteria bacterium]